MKHLSHSFNYSALVVSAVSFAAGAYVAHQPSEMRHDDSLSAELMALKNENIRLQDTITDLRLSHDSLSQHYAECTFDSGHYEFELAMCKDGNLNQDDLAVAWDSYDECLIELDPFRDVILQLQLEGFESPEVMAYFVERLFDDYKKTTKDLYQTPVLNKFELPYSPVVSSPSW